MSTEKTTATLRAELLELGHSLAHQARVAVSELPPTAEVGAYIQHLADGAVAALDAASDAERKIKQEEAIEQLVAMFGPLVEKFVRPSTPPHSVS
jgi:hypothetical protein